VATFRNRKLWVDAYETARPTGQHNLNLKSRTLVSMGGTHDPDAPVASDVEWLSLRVCELEDQLALLETSVFRLEQLRERLYIALTTPDVPFASDLE